MVTKAQKPNTAMVRRVLRSLDLDAVGKARGELAVTLAKHIDEAPSDVSLAALAASVKELRAILLELVPSTNDAGRSFIESLFRPKADS
jgi:hypothetical protein